MAEVDMEKIKEDLENDPDIDTVRKKIRKENPEMLDVLDGKADPTKTKDVPAPVVHAKTRKQPLKRKMANVFISDEFDSIPEFLWDKFSEAAIDFISDILHGTIDRTFNTGSRHSSSSKKRRRSGGRTSYERFYDDDDDWDDEPRRRRKRRHRRSNEFTEIIVGSKAERNKIISRMNWYIKKYGYVTVAQVKYTADLQPVYQTDHDFGWSDIEDVEFYRDGRDEIIELPEPEELED